MYKSYCMRVKSIANGLLAKLVNATFVKIPIWRDCKLEGKCVIYHHCPWFAPQFTHFCDIFSMTKFAVNQLFSPRATLNGTVIAKTHTTASDDRFLKVFRGMSLSWLFERSLHKNTVIYQFKVTFHCVKVTRISE